MLNALYPNENGAVYSYSYAGTSRERSLNIGSAHNTLNFWTFLIGSVDAVFYKVRVLVGPEGTGLLEDQAATIFSRISLTVTVSNENKALQWEEGLDQLCVIQADAANTVTTAALPYLMKLFL